MVLHPETRKICKLFREDPTVPTSIDMYKVGRVLGQGGFGKVHLALQRVTRKLVAIKTVKTSMQEDKKRIK